MNAGNSPYTVTAADYTMFCNAASGDRTVNLPAAAGNLGRVYVVRRTGGGSSVCNVDVVAGGTVVLGTTAGARRAIMVQSDGASWFIIADAYLQ